MTLHTFAPAGPPADSELARPFPGELAPVVRPISVVHPVTLPPTVPASVTHLTVNPALLYMRNPSFGWFLGAPQPRTGFALPTLISPVAPPVDQTLFQEPQDATKLHYLQQYAIATRGSGGSSQRWVTFAPAPAGFTLTVHLADVSPPALAQGNTPIVPTANRYMLTANLQGQAASWDFGTATTDAGDLA